MIRWLRTGIIGELLSSHLRLGISRGPFPVDLSVTSTVLKEELPAFILATCPANLFIFLFYHPDYMITLGERYRLCSSSLWSLLHSPLSSLMGPNIRLGILFSNILSLNSSLLSQPYSTTDNTNMLMFKFSKGYR